MAFIRRYAEQGDPRPMFTTMRGGRLRARVPLDMIAGRHPRAALRSAKIGRRRLLSGKLRSLQLRGDPFSFKKAFKLPKGFRQSFGGFLRLAGNVAPLFPGIGTAAGAALKGIKGAATVARLAKYAQPFLPVITGALAGGGGPESPAPELVQEPPQQGTVGRNFYEPNPDQLEQVQPLYQDELEEEIPDEEPEDEDEELFEEEDY